MRSGLQQQVGGPVRVSEVDLDASRDRRTTLHEQLRLREHLRHVLPVAPVGEGGLWIEDAANGTGRGNGTTR